MENRETFKTPSAALARMQVVHFGKIMFNLQFVAVAVMAASVLSFIMPAVYYLFLICIAIFSLFTLFANPTFRSFWSGGETLTKVAEVLAQSWKYTVPIVAVLALVSVLCLSFDKNKKHPARIAVSVIIFLLAVAVLILKLINKGAG